MTNSTSSNPLVMTHVLKTDPEVFDAVVKGLKTHEIRFDDRGFKPGDHLRLRRTKFTGEEMRNGAPLEYTGEVAARVISHIQRGYGLQKDWVILSFEMPAVPRDFITHKASWRDALLIAAEHAKVQPPDIDDKAYWLHELRAYDRAHAELAAKGGDTSMRRKSDKEGS